MRAFVKLAVLMLLSSISARAAAQDAGTPAVEVPSTPAPEVALHPERMELPGLPNLAHVEKGIYRGGRPQLGEGGAQSLAKLGIKRVIDLQGGDLVSASQSHWTDWPTIVAKMEPGETHAAIEEETTALQKIGVEMSHIPLDSLDPITPAEAESLERILQLLAASSPEMPIYVHCEHGKDRTGLVLALYRVRYDGWSEAKAAAEMAEMGHVGRLDEYFTGNMNLSGVLAHHPALGKVQPQAAPLAPATPAPANPAPAR